MKQKTCINRTGCASEFSTFYVDTVHRWFQQWMKTLDSHSPRFWLMTRKGEQWRSREIQANGVPPCEKVGLDDRSIRTSCEWTRTREKNDLDRIRTDRRDTCSHKETSSLSGSIQAGSDDWIVPRVEKSCCLLEDISVSRKILSDSITNPECVLADTVDVKQLDTSVVSTSWPHECLLTMTLSLVLLADG